MRKIWITNQGGTLVFDYVYQNDGTRKLKNTVATKPVSWGVVKVHYLDR